MNDHDDESQVLQHATAQPVPVVGEGCLQRYDPELLSDEHGADFSAAPLLYQQWQAQYPLERGEDKAPVTDLNPCAEVIS